MNKPTHSPLSASKSKKIVGRKQRRDYFGMVDAALAVWFAKKRIKTWGFNYEN